jgi:serine/threonine protein phosphatase PrpC
MEDAFIAQPLLSLPGHSLLAVFDGHAGSLVSKIASESLVSILESTAEWQQNCRTPERTERRVDILAQALVAAFVELDALLAQHPEVVNNQDMSGAAAIVAVVTPTHIVAANLGDSRCAVGQTARRGRTATRCVPLSEDHKPVLPEEAARIHLAGGFVLANVCD